MKQKFFKVKLEILDNGNTLWYYTDLPISDGDIVIADTKHGTIEAKVVAHTAINYNPFANGTAKAHILANKTTEMKGDISMISCKYTVTIQSMEDKKTDRTYKAGTNYEIPINTVVVFETQRGFEVGKILSGQLSEGYDKYWVVAPVDMAEFNRRRDAEARAAVLQRRLEAKRQKFEGLALYKLLAEVDPEAKGLLDELTGLSNTEIKEDYNPYITAAPVVDNRVEDEVYARVVRSAEWPTQYPAGTVPLDPVGYEPVERYDPDEEGAYSSDSSEKGEL